MAQLIVVRKRHTIIHVHLVILVVVLNTSSIIGITQCAMYKSEIFKEIATSVHVVPSMIINWWIQQSSGYLNLL